MRACGLRRGKRRWNTTRTGYSRNTGSQPWRPSRRRSRRRRGRADALSAYENVKRVLDARGLSQELSRWRCEVRRSEDVARQWPLDEPVTFVLIDGDHHYEAVKLDVALWLDILADGGILWLHDSRRQPGTPEGEFGTGWPGPTQVADELRQDGRVELVHEVHCSTVWRKRAVSEKAAKKAKRTAKTPRTPSVIAVEGKPGVRVLFNEARQGAIACWNQGLAAASGDILVFGNDDCGWEPGWLDAALRAHREELGGYGLVGFNDGYQDGNTLAVHYLFDRRFCVDHLGGVMAYPHYQFYCNDTEANARAKAAGRFVWCKLAVVQHNHWTRPGGGEADALDRENSAKSAHDIAEFERRKALGFPNDFEAVLK